SGGLELDEETIRSGGLSPVNVETSPERKPEAEEAPGKSSWLLPTLLLLSLHVLIAFVFLEWSDPSLVGILVGGVAVLFVALTAGARGKSAEPSPEPHDDASIRRPLAEVLAEHKHRVQHFLLAGRTLVPARTIEDRIEYKDLFYQHPSVLRELRGALWVILV